MKTLGYKYSWRSHDARGSIFTNIKLRRDNKFDINSVPKDKVEFRKNNGMWPISLNAQPIGVYIYHSPFGNCQNMAINNFRRLLSYEKEIIRQVFEFIAEKKQFVVVDVTNFTFTNYMQYPKEAFVFKTDYASTNGSKMVIAGLKARELINYYNK